MAKKYINIGVEIFTTRFELSYVGYIIEMSKHLGVEIEDLHPRFVDIRDDKLKTAEMIFYRYKNKAIGRRVEYANVF